jgi:hypothetical protein
LAAPGHQFEAESIRGRLAMKAMVTLLGVLALSCAAFGTAVDPGLIIQSSGGSWNLPFGTTSFSFTLTGNTACSNVTSNAGAVTLGQGTINPTACIFRNAGPAWPGITVLVNFLTPVLTSSLGAFSGSSPGIFPNVTFTALTSGLYTTGVLYSFSGLPGVPACPASNCEPAFIFSNMPDSTVTVNVVPEPASLALTGTGLLFLAPKVRKFLAKRMRIMS